MNRFWTTLIVAGLLSGCAGVSPQGNGAANAILPGSGAVVETPPEGESSPDFTKPTTTDLPPAPVAPPNPATPYSARFDGPVPSPMGGQPVMTPGIGPIASAGDPQSGGVFNPVAQPPVLPYYEGFSVHYGDDLGREVVFSQPGSVTVSESDLLDLRLLGVWEWRRVGITGEVIIEQPTHRQIRLIHSWTDTGGVIHRRYIDSMADELLPGGGNALFSLFVPQGGRLTVFLAADFPPQARLPFPDFSGTFRDLSEEAAWEAARTGFVEVGDLILQRMGAKEAATIREGNEAAGAVLQDPTQGLPATQPPLRDRPRNLLDP